MSFLDEVVTASDAARHCNVSRALIDYWREAGKLRPVGRFGRSRLYRLADVVELDADMRASRRSSRYDLEPAGA